MQKQSEISVLIPVWESRIAPLFDTATELVLVKIVAGEIVAKETHQFADQTYQEKVRQLVDLRVTKVVCGAVSQEFCSYLEAAELLVVSFVAGEVAVVIEELRKGQFVPALFAMPGCCGRQAGRGRRLGRGLGREQGCGQGRGQGRGLGLEQGVVQGAGQVCGQGHRQGRGLGVEQRVAQGAGQVCGQGRRQGRGLGQRQGQGQEQEQEQEQERELRQVKVRDQSLCGASEIIKDTKQEKPE